MDPRSPCPECKIVICGAFATGSLRAFLNGLRVGREHWTGLPVSDRRADRARARADLSAVIRLAREFASLAVDDPQQATLDVTAEHVAPHGVGQLAAWLTGVVGLIDAIGAAVFYDERVATEHPLAGEVGAVLTDICEHWEHRAREVWGIPEY